MSLKKLLVRLRALSDQVCSEWNTHITSGWHRRRTATVCLRLQSKEALVWGARVHGEQRVIMLHPVASGRFTKPDMGGQACQANRGGEHGNKRL